jgi:mRNA interferase RelE/StbE
LKVEFRETFLKDLQNVNNAKLSAKVKAAIENAELARFPLEIHNFKKLKGFSNYFRIKIGEYRIGLAMENDTVTFVRFLPRREIYRFFP